MLALFINAHKPIFSDITFCSYILMKRVLQLKLFNSLLNSLVFFIGSEIFYIIKKFSAKLNGMSFASQLTKNVREPASQRRKTQGFR